MGLEDRAMMRAMYGSTVLHPCDARRDAGIDRRAIAEAVKRLR